MRIRALLDARKSEKSIRYNRTCQTGSCALVINARPVTNIHLTDVTNMQAEVSTPGSVIFIRSLNAELETDKNALVS